MTITTAEARAIAAGYADGPCPAVTAFARGERVSYEDFTAQVDMLASEYGFEAHDDVRALTTWAGDTADPVWR